jgi:hypothetical protein
MTVPRGQDVQLLIDEFEMISFRKPYKNDPFILPKSEKYTAHRKTRG